MANDCSDSAVVHCGICLGIECWRLQKCRRKDDLTESTIVIGIHGLRLHRPFQLIYGSMKLIYVVPPIESRCVLNISHEIVLINAQSVVIAPVIWIADLNRILLQFMKGFSLC